MALTVIPEKDFEQLVSGVSEDITGSNFDFDVMTKDYSSSYRNILSYMKTTNVKKIGTGSSRTAFFLPAGSVKEDKTRPSCFKVAKNKKGIAQNNAEISIYRQYGKKRDCFSELFDCDDKNKYFIQTEVGRKLKKNELKTFFKDWNDYVYEQPINIEDSEYMPFYFFGDEDGTQFTEDRDFTFRIFQICSALCTPFDEIANDFTFPARFVAGWYDDPTYVIDDIGMIADKFPKYHPIVDLFQFAVDGGWEEGSLIDLARNLGNWAMTIRDGEYTLLPIDFGFTNEVQEQYYS